MDLQTSLYIENASKHILEEMNNRGIENSHKVAILVETLFRIAHSEKLNEFGMAAKMNMYLKEYNKYCELFDDDEDK